MKKTEIVLVLDNIRSLHNVGSLLRTADAMAVAYVKTCGTTPHPQQAGDKRLPHVIKRAEAQLSKTALGAEKSVSLQHYDTTKEALEELKQQGYYLAAIELSSEAEPLTALRAKPKVALVLGHEIDGLSDEVLEMVDGIYEIPMLGKKHSLNVAIAGSIALYQLRHLSTT